MEEVSKWTGRVLQGLETGIPGASGGICDFGGRTRIGRQARRQVGRQVGMFFVYIYIYMYTAYIMKQKSTCVVYMQCICVCFDLYVYASICV